MKYELRYDQCLDTLDANDTEMLEEELTCFGGDPGAWGFKEAVLIGPAGQKPVMRFGLDDHVGRGFLYWYPDFVYAQSSTGRPNSRAGNGSPDELLHFSAREGSEVLALDDELCGLTPETVREAVREYIRTGQRPTNVTWDESSGRST